MSQARLHVTISGQVQGVFFRANTRREALALGLNGWVRNLPDGQVEAMFEGPRGVLEQMLDWCQHGPAYAHVTGVEAVWGEYQGEFAGFTIRGW